MALHGKREPNFSALSIGQDRQVVLVNFGEPVKTSVSEGKRVDVFELERGNTPSAGRAVGHGVMDVFTLGLWEVIGTPVEATVGEKFTVVVEYDETDKVAKVYRPKKESATRGKSGSKNEDSKKGETRR
jgi:hypothetical protein